MGKVQLPGILWVLFNARCSADVVITAQNQLFHYGSNKDVRQEVVGMYPEISVVGAFSFTFIFCFLEQTKIDCV